MQKLFAHLDFHCNPRDEPCARKRDRVYSRCENCRVYVFADRFMGSTFQTQILGGITKNPHILILDSVGCQYRCWFCYARDILDARNPISPTRGWKTYKFMSPQDIADCTACKLSLKYSDISSKRPFARFRITGGEPLFATKQTIRNADPNPVNSASQFWIDTFLAINTTIQQLKHEEKIEIISYDEFVQKGRWNALHNHISTWITQVPEKIEIRFDTNGQLFSANQAYTEAFVKSLLSLHQEEKLDSIRINIDYSIKGPSPIEFEWSQSRSLPVNPALLRADFDISLHPQYPGIKYLRRLLHDIYEQDHTFSQSLRLDIERGINFTDTSKYGTRKLGVLYDHNALDWQQFALKANIVFSEVNNPIQLSGQAPRSKYIEDHLRMGTEVKIMDVATNKVLNYFDPYPRNPSEWNEYRQSIQENLAKANHLISNSVKQAKVTGQFPVQVVFSPVYQPQRKGDTSQRLLSQF